MRKKLNQGFLIESNPAMKRMLMLLAEQHFIIRSLPGYMLGRWYQSGRVAYDPISKQNDCLIIRSRHSTGEIVISPLEHSACGTRALRYLRRVSQIPFKISIAFNARPYRKKRKLWNEVCCDEVVV